MDSLYLLQFACFIFMLINALILGITHLHMKWDNRRYEWSRWMILAGMMGLAIQYLLQMLLGFRAKSDDLGAVFNILVYTPCITLIGKRVRDAAFFLIIMLVTFAATLLNPQKYVSSRTIQKCVEHVSTST